MYIAVVVPVFVFRLIHVKTLIFQLFTFKMIQKIIYFCEREVSL